MPSEKRECVKCEQKFYCDKHHILPQGLFGEGETADLCKNCHDEFHRYLGHKYLRKENRQSMEFYLEKWYTWLYMLSISGALIGLWAIFG